MSGIFRGPQGYAGLNSEPGKTRSLQESRPRKREAKATVDGVSGWRKHGAEWQDRWTEDSGVGVRETL